MHCDTERHIIGIKTRLFPPLFSSNMNAPFDYYPFEIFDKVAYYLTSKQRGVCQTVCRSWRALFTPPQYRHVHIRGQRQFSQFYQSLEPGVVGHYVRRLSMEDVNMATEELESLPLFCPNLVAFSFNGKSTCTAQSTSQQPLDIPYGRWKHLRRLTELQDLTVTNHLLQAPYSPLSSLTHLSIRFNNTNRTAKKDFLKSLYRATDLISLSLDSVTLSLSEIEAIHHACPHLSKLTLINTQLEPIGYTLEEKRAVALYSFKPANKLTQFAFQNGQDLYDDYEWLYYFAHKYPCLEGLELWCAYSIDTPTRVQASVKDLEERYGALSRIGVMCRSLKSVKLLNITMNYWIFEAMDRVGTKLESIALGDMSDNTVYLLQSLAASQQNVSCLTLWGWPSLCIQETMEETIAMVGQCSNRLSRFTFSMRFSGIKNAPIPVEQLLSHCRHLNYLKLDHTQVALVSTMDRARDVFTNNHDAFVHPMLRHLVLENGCFRNQVFDYMGMRCPNLKSLEISSCSLIGDTSIDSQVKIDLPHHALDMISITHLRPPTYYHHARTASDIRMFDITLLNENKHLIYELTDYEKYTATLCFDYEQKPLELSRPTKYICHTSERPAGPFVSIQCQSVTELNIGTFWIL
jgi:hypothetical protein